MLTFSITNNPRVPTVDVYFEYRFCIPCMLEMSTTMSSSLSSLHYALKPQDRERATFRNSYKAPENQATVLTRDRYELILEEMIRDGDRSASGNSNAGLDARQMEQMKNMRQRFRVKKWVGGQTTLLRIFGPHPKRYYAETANYPRVVCEDELFDIIWTAHHKNGHMKTPQALQKNIQNDGIWGVPRPAVKIFVVGCLVCARNTSVTKQVRFTSSQSITHALPRFVLVLNFYLFL